MAFTSPKTWSGSEVLTSADMNAQVSGNIDYIYDNFALSNQWINQGTSIAQANQRIESGLGTIAFTTTQWGTAAVTFNTAFGTTPRIVVTGGTLLVHGAPINAGTAGFIASITRDGGTMTGSYQYNWIAIGA